MINKVKIQFSIKELENLSGVKAHTIRIWEKRYAIFSPSRTETNIRYYSLEELQKLLNIKFLINYGYKISRIAKFSEEDIGKMVLELYSEKTNIEFSRSILKIAMLNFDAALFDQTCVELLKTKSFEDVFIEVFIPFLYDIGLLWQTNAIKPIHEHFISHLIYLKLVENTNLENTKIKQFVEDKIFVLFLPENEVHEISLMFLNYLLIRKGYRTIYLGSSVPFEDLLELDKFYGAINYVSNFTISPSVEGLNDYIDKFHQFLLQNNSNKFFISGYQTQYLLNYPEKVNVFKSLDEIISLI